jgi:serine protease Do
MKTISLYGKVEAMKKVLGRFLVILILLSLSSSAHGASANRQTPVVAVVREWGPNVVNIGTEKVVLVKQNPFWRGYNNELNAFFQNFNAPQLVSPMKINSIGSGVIISQDGLIVTNAHVVNMASKVFVTFSDGKAVEGSVMAVDQQDDLAFVKITPPYPLKEIKLAGTGDVQVGESVIAIGNPLGLENSVSVGVVSGKNRFFQNQQHNIVMNGLIQTDAAINAGNSGGALLNLDGELVGVNLAVVQNASNIGFAIPSDKIKAVLELYRNAKKQQEESAPKSARVQVG